MSAIRGSSGWRVEYWRGWLTPGFRAWTCVWRRAWRCRDNGLGGAWFQLRRYRRFWSNGMPARFSRRWRGPGSATATESSRLAAPGLLRVLSSVSIESMARQLLARDQILAARKLVDAIPSDRFSESLRRLRVVLAEPVVRRRLPARAKRSGDIDWLRRNARSYSGKWVAMADGELIAADESLAALRRRLRELAPKIKPLLHRL